MSSTALLGAGAVRLGEDVGGAPGGDTGGHHRQHCQPYQGRLRLGRSIPRSIPARKSSSIATRKPLELSLTLRSKPPVRESPTGGQSSLGGADAAQLRYRCARLSAVRGAPRADRDRGGSGGDRADPAPSTVAGDDPRALPHSVAPVGPGVVKRPVARGATGHHAPKTSRSLAVRCGAGQPAGIAPCAQGQPAL